MKNIALIISLAVATLTVQAQSTIDEPFASKQNSLYAIDDPTEGKIPMGTYEIPEKVWNAFQNSVFQHTEVVQVYLLQAYALQEIIGSESSDTPLYLYEFQLRVGGKLLRQYFTAEGDLYEVASAV